MKKLLPLLVLLGWAAAAHSAALAANWSHWRGPEQNGVSRDRDLPDKFSPNPKADNSNLIWKAPYGGRSTPIIQNGRVYLINKVGEGVTEQERVMCFNEADGKVLWEHRFNVFLTDIVSARLGWTTLAGDPETGNVYAHGTQGLFFCFDKDGKILWQHSLTEEYGRISGYGGRVTSPIVDGDLVLMGMVNASWGYQGMGRTRFVAFDKKTGNIVWWGSTGLQVKDTYYSTPIAANIAGERLLISGGGDGGVHAFKIRTGEKVWSYVFGTGAVNCSPVVDGDKVYIGHGEDNDDATEQGRVICLDGGKVEKGHPKLVWKVDGIKAKFASPVIYQGRLYIPDDLGKLFCLDAANGKILWDFQFGNNTRGSPVLADGKIYIPEVDSKFHILKPGDTSCESLHAQFFKKQAGGANVEINGSAAVVNGHVYFMTSDALYCIGKKDHHASADKIPAEPAEAPLENPAKRAHLQILPADVMLYPGQSAEFKVRAFNDKGQLLGEVKADWSLAPMRTPEGLPPPKGPPPPAPPVLQGELSDKSGTTTKLTVAKVPPGQFGRVVAKLGGLEGEARVRVAPRVPYAPDFSKVPETRTPGGWVNTQGKFGVFTLDGRKVLKKLAINPSPLVARGHAYIGPPDTTNYTIEADVRGGKVGGNLPDGGVVANRYTLVLVGNTQQLRLISWDAIPRVDVTIAYPWKAGEWYRMKLTVELQGDKGIAKGKVWPRDQPEPREWTVEFTDPIPNREGSPALYANATGIDLDTGKTGAEVFFDNVKITPNKKAEGNGKKE